MRSSDASSKRRNFELVAPRCMEPKTRSDGVARTTGPSGTKAVSAQAPRFFASITARVKVSTLVRVACSGSRKP